MGRPSFRREGFEVGLGSPSSVPGLCLLRGQCRWCLGDTPAAHLPQAARQHPRGGGGAAWGPAWIAGCFCLLLPPHQLPSLLLLSMVFLPLWPWWPGTCRGHHMSPLPVSLCPNLCLPGLSVAFPRGAAVCKRLCVLDPSWPRCGRLLPGLRPLTSARMSRPRWQICLHASGDLWFGKGALWDCPASLPPEAEQKGETLLPRGEDSKFLT